MRENPRTRLLFTNFSCVVVIAIMISTVINTFLVLSGRTSRHLGILPVLLHLHDLLPTPLSRKDEKGKIES